MLINKGYEQGDVICFKVVNGDEMVATYVKETTSEFVINKPTIVVPTQQGISLMQAMFAADLTKEIPLSKSAVMLHASATKQMSDHYLEATSSIQLVRKGGIVT